MPVRKVITRRSNHFRVYVPSLKNGHPTPCESLLEGAAARILELSGRVRRYEVQPSIEDICVNGHAEHYIPDFRVWFYDGTEAFLEVKPAVRLRVIRVANRIAAAKVRFVETCRQFQVITDTWLATEPRATNAATLMYHRCGTLTPVELDHFRRTLLGTNPHTLVELCSALGREDAWRILGLGLVGLNLDCEIHPDSTIYLTGGHRHANLVS